MFPRLILQFDDDEDDGEMIRKGGEISVPGVVPWQTIKTENKGNYIGLLSL